MKRPSVRPLNGRRYPLLAGQAGEAGAGQLGFLLAEQLLAAGRGAAVGRDEPEQDGAGDRDRDPDPEEEEEAALTRQVLAGRGVAGEDRGGEGAAEREADGKIAKKTPPEAMIRVPIGSRARGPTSRVSQGRVRLAAMLSIEKGTRQSPAVRIEAEKPKPFASGRLRRPPLRHRPARR